MHALHKIVVEAEDAEIAVSEAKSGLESYYLTVYDYFDEDASGWGDAFACPLSAEHDKDRFLKELEDVRKTQRAEAFDNLRGLEGIDGQITLEGALRAVFYGPATSLDSYRVGAAFDLARGRYRFDSGFLDIANGHIAAVTDELVSEVEKGGKDLWMVFFDLHF